MKGWNHTCIKTVYLHLPQCSWDQKGVGVVIVKAVQSNKTVAPASTVKTNLNLEALAERNSAASSVNVSMNFCVSRKIPSNH